MNGSVTQSHSGMLNFISKLDIFGKAVPAFNIKGRGKVDTVCGGLASLFIIYITFLYASLKLMHLNSKH